MLIMFLILIFGFITAKRILREVFGQNILTKKQMTNFGTSYVVLLVSFSYFSTHIIAFWALAFFPHVIFSIFIVLLKQFRRKKFEERFEELLSLLILKMKSGKGFRNSFSEVISECPRPIQRILIDIHDVVVFSQQSNSERISAFVQTIILEFVEADHAPHAALKRLQGFRERLKIQSDFRRKSGQVLQQIRLQSLILSGIYFALLFFVIGKFGFESNQQSILLSLMFFGLGIAFIFNKRGHIKWKL